MSSSQELALALARRAAQSLRTLVVGSERATRRIVGATLLAFAVNLVCLLCVHLNVVFGFSDPQQARWLGVYLMSGPTLFYQLARSGFSRRFRDPGMAVPQTLYAISALVLAYPVNGPVRGLNLFLVALLPFFGFLSLSPRQLRQLAALSLAAFGSVMAVLVRVDPVRFDPRVEAFHFIFAAICLPCMALVLGEASNMRARVSAQRGELEAALHRIEAISNRDELTGLYNRRHASVRLEEECRRRDRQRHRFCVALIDLDHFKRINDSCGHARGDAVLCHFARVAQACLAAGHELARWGGEEFLLLLPGADIDAASALLAAIRTRLAESASLGVGVGASLGGIQLSFSAGVTAGDASGSSAILERADRALYRAKAEGRNRDVRG